MLALAHPLDPNEFVATCTLYAFNNMHMYTCIYIYASIYLFMHIQILYIYIVIGIYNTQ